MQAATAATSAKVWYVRHSGPDGKMTVTKMSTGEVMAGIKGDKLDLTAKAKDSANGSFLPLAQYKEFDSLVQQRQVRTEAAAKSEKTKKLYDKLDRQEARRRRWRFLGRWLGNVKDIVNFILYLAIIIGIGYGIYAFGIPYIQTLLKKQ